MSAPGGTHDELLARVFAALGDPTRLKLITLLCATSRWAVKGSGSSSRRASRRRGARWKSLGDSGKQRSAVSNGLPNRREIFNAMTTNKFKFAVEKISEKGECVLHDRSEAAYIR